MANAQDPRGWLDACPELTQFTSDPKVSAAIAGGDGAKLFAALQARRRGPRAAFERRTLDAILQRRRLFTAPMRGAPSLYTLNGFGTRIYGKGDLAQDGTYVGTLFLTALFLPIWPLAQYLCWSSGSQYSFFGKLPLSRAMRLWRGAVAAGVAVVAVATAAAVWAGAREVKGFVVNGLDVPVVVSGAGHPSTVAPGGRASVTFAAGRQHLEASAAGRVIEAIDVDVPRWTDVVVYNVLGAAPLYAQGEYYYPKGKSPAQASEPPFEFYGGRSFTSRDGVAYRFAPAPKSIQTESSARRELRWSVDVMEGGWKRTVAVLEYQGKLAEAAAVAARVASAEPQDREVLSRWIALAQLAGGPASAVAAAKALADAAPGDVDAQRAYSHFLVAAGRRDEARRIFGDRARKDPSAAAGYLRARVEAPPRALAMFEALAKAHPSDPNIRRGLAWQFYSAGRWSDALREYGVLARLAPEDRPAMAGPVAVSLAALGRAPDALARVDQAADMALDIHLAVLHAQVARLARAEKPASHYLARLAEAREEASDRDAWRTYGRVWGHVLAGEPPPDPKEVEAIPFPTQRDACRVMVAAAADPAAALKLAASANRAALAEVADVVAVLLAGEAARLGRDDLAVALAEASGHLEAPGRAVVAFVRGEDPVELKEQEPEVRAALLLARARAEQAYGRDAAPILDEVRANDVLQGAVANAIARWPAAAR